MEATAEALAELGVNLTVVNIYEEMGSETEDGNQLFEDQEIWVCLLYTSTNAFPPVPDSIQRYS